MFEQDKVRLVEYIDRYKVVRDSLRNESEQMMRSWIDELLGIFGWDCQNPYHVSQEKMVSRSERERLEKINSKHKKPDYTLKNGRVRVAFLDAKDLKDNIRDSKEIAFQARSYGWSAGFDCTIVTNVEEIAFYWCYTVPNKNDDVQVYRDYFSIDEYIDKFDILYTLLNRDSVLSGKQEEYFKEKNKLSSSSLIEIDQSFVEILNDFRLKLANDIVKNNPIINSNKTINIMVQIIIDRIIFLRICEGRGLEEEETLLKLKEGNFWDNFKKKTTSEYEIVYCGPIFTHLEFLDSVVINNNVFENFLEKLYYPYPYKFDVVPVEIIAAIYESFLSKELVLKAGKVIQMEKDFYVKQQGAISTPAYVVESVIKQTLNNLEEVKKLDDLFNIKIFEPACGSGTFLIGLLDFLEKKCIDLYEKGLIEEQQRQFFVEYEGIIYTTVELRKKVINDCLFGADMDYQAVEVAKFSLALKVLDNYSLNECNEKFGFNKKKLLDGIGKNIIHGNTLVEFDITTRFPKISVPDVYKIVPINLKSEESIKGIFINKGGFDYIIGNPPYVETKQFIDTLPYCRDYFKMKYQFDDQKADMSIYFIERCLSFLNKNGRLGFVIQKRFFKTNYGEKAREFIANNNLLNTLIDFETEKIFKGRTTYVAIMVFDKQKNTDNTLNYLNINQEPSYLKRQLSKITNNDFRKINSNILLRDTWNFSSLQELVEQLEKKFPTIQVLKGRKVCDIHGGIQVLRNDVYYINVTSIDQKNQILYGINRRKTKDNQVEIELDLCRPIIANRSLKKFQTLKPNYYAIVPYTRIDTKEIDFDELNKRYPLAAKYLSANEDYIKQENKQFYDGQRWHLFTRLTNLKMFSNKKIMFPMTSKEVIASYINTPAYPDNSNMWFMEFSGKSDDFHLAITAILNSKLFSVMAIHFSNPQANGYKKMNKQFISQVTIPYDKVVQNKDVLYKLRDFSVEINDLIDKGERIVIDGEKRINEEIINQKFDQLNSFVNDLYELTEEQRRMVENYYSQFMQGINQS